MSDIHAEERSTGRRAPEDIEYIPRSHLQVATPEDDPGKHPLVGLRDLIKRERLAAEMLVCGGDMSDRAHPSAVKYTWAKLHDLAGWLSCERVIATAGNHDVDSRYKHNDYDAKGLLQSLSPPFPLGRDDLGDQYWARHYAFVTGPEYRVLVLNSSAYHGGAPTEHEHGRVSDRTLAAVQAALEQTEARPVNILLCHHHPEICNPLEIEDYEVMKNGRKLMDILGSGRYGRWLVIHGHRHYPRLAYAYGGATAPVIMSAGSLSAILYAELQTVARNQFYIVTIDTEDVTKFGLVGTVEAFQWSFGMGWKRGGTRETIPAYAGFGYREDPSVLARRVRATLRTDIAQWSDIQDHIPEVRYLLPLDEDLLVAALEWSHGLTVHRESDGRILQIGVAT